MLLFLRLIGAYMLAFLGLFDQLCLGDAQALAFSHLLSDRFSFTYRLINDSE